MVPVIYWIKELTPRPHRGQAQHDSARATIHQVRPTGYSTQISARQLEEISMTYVGLLVDDEDTEMSETTGQGQDAAELP